jgi:hypothetical protein
MVMKFLNHLLQTEVRILAGAVIEMITTDDATKAIEDRIATDENIVAMCIGTNTTKVHPVKQIQSLIYPATVVDQMQTVPFANA